LSTRKNIAAFDPNRADHHGCIGFGQRFRERLAGLARSCLVAVPLLWCQELAIAWDLPKEPSIVGNESQVPVGPGESLYDVARRHGFAMEHLAEANGLPVSLAAVGRESLLLPGRRILPANPPRPGLVVNLPERGFYVFPEGNPRFFPIAVGEPGRFATPTGSFTIIEKVENPAWVAPEWAGMGENNVVPAGPDNPLGDRWIGLSSSGLGMHSTNNPASIGSATSHGCMRMYPEIARVVFDLVKTGWPVRIEYETARVGLARSGIYVSAFPDIYSRGQQMQNLRRQFEREDLLGFFSEAACRPVLQAARGVPERIVDMSPKAWLGPDWYPAARVGTTLLIEQGLLDKAGVSAHYSLSDRSVRLVLGSRQVSLPLYLAGDQEREPEQAFLSRGSGWFPARKTLGGLGLGMTWEGGENLLRVQP
jgi:L,D-transpeptidase ErfK/SrfK